MNEGDDELFERRLRQALAGRPEAPVTRRLARRARARAEAKMALARHRRWTRWSLIGAVVLIAGVVAGVAMFAPGWAMIWSSGFFSTTASSASSSSGEISGSLQWMLIGFGMMALCILILGVWRTLVGEEGNLSLLGVSGW